MLHQIRHVLETLAPHAASPLKGLPAADAGLIQRIRATKLTYLSERKLAGLARTCHELEERGRPGLFLEAGCALGGSTILIASLKAERRPLRAYDVFDMIPPPSAEDPPEVHARYRVITEGQSKGIDGDTYYGYQDHLYEQVQANLLEFGVDAGRQNVTLIKGMVQDTLAVMEPVAFAHVDVDWYEPVKTCLERIFPWLVPGGCIVLDDYHDWGGCRRATDEYLKRVAGRYDLDDSAGSLKITRLAH